MHCVLLHVNQGNENLFHARLNAVQHEMFRDLMSRKILGLDISDNAVSAVLVRGGIKGNRIEDHRHIPLSTGSRQTNRCRCALETVAAEMDLEGATCIASLPASHASYRNMEAPFKEMKKLRQILPYELESILPYPPENVIIDFNVLDSLGDTERHISSRQPSKKKKWGSISTC